MPAEISLLELGKMLQREKMRRNQVIGGCPCLIAIGTRVSSKSGSIGGHWTHTTGGMDEILCDRWSKIRIQNISMGEQFSVLWEGSSCCAYFGRTPGSQHKCWSIHKDQGSLYTLYQSSESLIGGKYFNRR